jgi:hypothetical protein
MQSPVSEGLQYAVQQIILNTESVENLLDHLVAISFLLQHLPGLVISHLWLESV